MKGIRKMKKMKSLISIVLVLVLALSLTACGEKTTPETPATPAETETPASETPDASAEVGEYNWNLAIDSPEDTVTFLYGKKFADLVSEASGGKMKIQIFANGTLGGDREALESCLGGDVNFIVQTTAPQVNFMPKLAVFDLPVAYATIDEVRAALDNSDFMSTINQVYADGGYKLLGYADQSFRIMSTNKKVESMDDFKGQKIRTMENPNHLAFWKALGANPAPMAFAEVYIGLQQGTIDAQENPYEVIVANKLYEQQKYVVQTNHIPHILSLITNKALYDGLNDAEKAIIDEAVTEAKAYAREQADSRAEERMNAIKDSGTEVVPVSAELYEQIKTAVQPVFDEIRSQVGDDLVDAYLGE
ncbi:TRAP transporter substrate-binding protein [Sedimentibacter acidaminivorans]|jgi:TRAP-type transport system periplasmic protein|nr:TRAP transporter substrate-binding protein [Sedimentibacter acidaminivorans]